VGDIISFWSATIETTVIHRIVEVGKDNQGVYFVTKGDNNLYKDPEKVRFEQVKGVVVGIIY
jgi:signal peptidase I